ncbi:MAG TPA: hypothetical protein VGS19_20695 [Streptosporangiaceae bacterium]|nr:hypothetical protein [Streptosporangiaceae bacterium]
MLRHTVRTLLVAAVTGAGFVAVGLAGSGAAAAGTHAATHPVVYTSSQAGYSTTGRLFRFVDTTVKVPAAGTYNTYAEVVLGGTHAAPVTLAVKAGGGPNSVGWAVGVPPFGMGGGTLSRVAPKPGDTVFIALYYDRADGGVTATATDLTTKATQSFGISPGTHAQFNAAEVAGVVDNPKSPPATDLRLWQATNSAVTTYTGVHGTLTGNWITNQIIDTTNGGPTGHVVMSPSPLFNNGANFGCWLRTYLRH